MRISVWLCISSCIFLASCASLKGIPQGLTDQNTADMAKNTLEDSLKVSNDLSKTYKTARDENLDYAFWSNVAFVPLAAGAAGAIAFNAYKDLLAGIGIAAGSLGGLNVFINARANAKVYQSGMNGLACISTNLTPYLTLNADALEAEVLALGGQIALANQTLAEATSLRFDTPQQIAEIKSNPLVVTTLAASERILTQAIADAQKALGDGESETVLFAGIATFAASSIRQVDAIVASKITQPDISFSALQSSITGLTKAPAATPKPAPPAAGAHAIVPAVPSTTPIADAANDAQRSSQTLAKATTEMSAHAQKFGLSTQQKAVGDCIKGL